MTYVVGVDLGATNLRAAVAGADGDVVGRDRRKTPRDSGTAVVDALCATVRAALADADVPAESVSGAGIASVGPLDRERGVLVDPANLPGGEIPVVASLRELLGTDRVSLVNDATAGVVAERAADGAPEDVVYLTVSSGIGAGVAVDGRVLVGRQGGAGEVGHWVVDPRGERTCGCGRDGHWEAYCGGKNLPEYARDLADDTETALPLDSPGFSAADVFAHADDDPLAAEVVERVAEWNVVGVTNLVQAYAPDLVSVGGAVALENESLVVDPIRDRLDDTCLNDVPDVRCTPFGGDAPLRGALASALEIH